MRPTQTSQKKSTTSQTQSLHVSFAVQEKDRDRDRGERADAPPARQTSEERRAMIASWNAEKETWKRTS